MLPNKQHTRHAWLKHLIQWLGYTILCICVGFLLLRIWEVRSSLPLEKLGLDTLLLLLLCGISFAISQFLLSSAWYFLLKWWGITQAKLACCHSLYGRTQIAKYLPGNIFHFAGRQMATKYFGGSQAAIAGASLFEILGLFISSGLMALAGMAYYHMPQTTLTPETLALMLIVAALMLIIISISAQRLAIIKGVFPADHQGSSLLKQILPAYTCYLLFFILYSGHMALLLNQLTDIDLITNLARLVSVVSIAWLAGYITPGAPGGLGVREALLVLGLSPLIGEAEAMIAAFALRLVTIQGDLFFFLIALRIPLPAELGAKNTPAK